MTTVAVVGLVVSLVAVGLVRAWALRADLLDRPNARSSHTVPVPRGGGSGLLLGWLCALLAARLQWDLALLSGVAGVLLVAWIGWRDDRGGVPVRQRLLVHVVTGLAMLPLAPTWPGGVWLMPLWVLATVAAINVVNFMDGIDGLVASQLLVFAAYLVLLGGDGAMPAAALGGALLGFLWWNRPPARIFMGDVGSGALGATAVLLSGLALRSHAVSPLVVALPLAPLILDASVTLVRRWRAGQRLTEAHRSHLYQRVANAGVGHARVTAAFTIAAALALPAGVTGGPMVGLYLISLLIAYHLGERRWPFERTTAGVHSMDNADG